MQRSIEVEVDISSIKHRNSFECSNPLIVGLMDSLFTVWIDCDKVTDVWNDAGPILFNPQIPHNIKGDVGVDRRLSMTLRFNESYESLRDKLND
jgi:hypothetical protein